ncbi:hypothetical protein INT47_002538 [Mucor saturninus]|uniref:Myb/SANT-like domain-containing protein n=1 Tax=Mucor saturninus TaxID=64648 RepID=A0A8H7RG80_9FUNG|nr:hypothetical protein INT47_002538 [Mucor saturninus]
MGRSSIPFLTASTSTVPTLAPIIATKHSTSMVEEDEMSSGIFTSGEWDYESTLELIHVFIKYGLRLEASSTAAEISIYNLAMFRKFNKSTRINGRRSLLSLKERWVYLYETYQERKNWSSKNNAYPLPFWEFHEHMRNGLSASPLVICISDNTWTHLSESESDTEYFTDRSDEEDREEHFDQSISGSKRKIQANPDIKQETIKCRRKSENAEGDGDHVNIYGSEYKRLADIIKKSIPIIERSISTMERGISTMEKGISTMERNIAAMKESTSTMENGISTIEKSFTVIAKGILIMENNESTKHDILEIQKGFLTQFKIAVDNITKKTASKKNTYDTNINESRDFDKLQREFFIL